MDCIYVRTDLICANSAFYVINSHVLNNQIFTDFWKYLRLIFTANSSFVWYITVEIYFSTDEYNFFLIFLSLIDK